MGTPVSARSVGDRVHTSTPAPIPSPHGTPELRRAAVAVARERFAAPTGSPEYDALPAAVKTKLSARLLVLSRIHASPCKRTAIAMEAADWRGVRGMSEKRLAGLYAQFARGTDQYAPWDWRIALDKSAAGAAWWSRESERGLPKDFVGAVRELWIENKRSLRSARVKLLEWWRSGIRRRGAEAHREPVPGYGYWQQWYQDRHPGAPLPADVPVPAGWTYSNLRASCKLGRAELALARVGTAAARAFTPAVLTTRVGARWLERVLFDDVKTDFRVWDSVTGAPVDLWLLVAQDYASACYLGFWMRPARGRDDGSAEHLRGEDMRHFAGWLLETWGLPAGEYAMEWKVENGTATFSEACAQALGALFGGRLTVSYARMIGGRSAAGFRERGTGNSRAKASLESSFNLLHNYGADLPGQTGRRYDLRPSDLLARERECVSVWQALAGHEDLRAEFTPHLLTLEQARGELRRIFHAMNSRTEHDLEGFNRIVEWRLAGGIWQPLTTCPNPEPSGAEWRQRKESPYERMRSLAAHVACERVPASALTVFYETTQRLVTVNAAGEIAFQADGRDLVWRAPEDAGRLAPGTKALVYHCPEEPEFLHLTRPAPHQGYIGTWVRRQRVALGDRDGVSREMEYCEAAMKARKSVVAALSIAETAAVDARREQHAALVTEARERGRAIDAEAVSAARIGAEAAEPGLATAIQCARASVVRTQETQRAEADDLDRMLEASGL